MNKKLLALSILVAAIIIAMVYWKSETSQVTEKETQPIAEVEQAPTVEPIPEPSPEKITSKEPERPQAIEEPDTADTNTELEEQERLKTAQLALKKSWGEWNKLLAEATNSVGTKALLESPTFAALNARNPSEQKYEEPTIDAAQIENDNKTLQQNIRALAAFYPSIETWQQAKAKYDKQLPLWDAFKQKFNVDLSSADADAVAYLERKMTNALQAEDYIVAARSADLIRDTYEKWPKKYKQDLIEQATPKMIKIKGGEFVMGDINEQGQKDELPARTRQVSDFSIAETEITFEQYDAYLIYEVLELNDDSGWGREKRPAMNVSYSDATKFAAWLSQVTNRRFTLPTEEQWEYAARAGSSSPFSFGQSLTQKARCEGCDAWSQTQSLEVRQFEPNQFGLYDMHGNVWEWTNSCHTPSYAEEDIIPDDSCEKRVARGGGWRDLPLGLRSANRNPVQPEAKSNQLGFRLVELTQRDL